MLKNVCFLFLKPYSGDWENNFTRFSTSLESSVFAFCSMVICSLPQICILCLERAWKINLIAEKQCFNKVCELLNHSSSYIVPKQQDICLFLAFISQPHPKLQPGGFSFFIHSPNWVMRMVYPGVEILAAFSSQWQRLHTLGSSQPWEYSFAFL